MNWNLPEIVIVGVLAAKESGAQTMVATLLGALVGGFVVIGGDFVLKKREQRLEFIERDYELYIIMNEVINDVWAIGSRYIPAVEKFGWPMSPSTVMQPAIGDKDEPIKVPARLLTTIRTPEGKGLPHKALEISNFRNIIVAANQKFQELHTKVVEMCAPYADISKGTKLSAELDSRIPEHRAIIVAIERADSMAKQLLELILDFYQYAIEMTDHYNRYHKAHPIKKLRSILIDIDGIKSAMSLYRSETTHAADSVPT